MNVRTLCLAILNLHDSTGYEIRKLSTDGPFSHFVDASYGSIYPALAKMEVEALVTSREEPQVGKPARKVYSITESGREAFADALAKPISRDIFKSEFLLVAMCAEMMEPKHVLDAIMAHRAFLVSELSIIATAKEDIQLPGAQWVADYGQACLNKSLEYLDANRDHLESIAGTKLDAASPLLAAE